MDNLLFNPYNYILSFTDYLSIPDIITTINENTSKTYQIINDTIELSINDINSMSINDFTMNNIYNAICEYKVFISMTTLFSISLLFYINNLMDEYLTNINYNNNHIKKNNSLNINTLKINDTTTTTIINHLENQISNQKDNKLIMAKKLITKGLFIDSVLEINANNKNIFDKIMVNESNNNNYYYALLRIKMTKDITLNKTNYNLQHIIVNTDNDAETFNTGDMYMIIKFKYKSASTTINLSQVILNVMNTLNYLSKDELKNQDFIVLAISKDKDLEKNNPYEFYNGLRNINYDILNTKHIQLDKEHKIGFTLLLPIKQIYDLFLDVYNDTIFESTSYKIDFDNNEYWYNNSMNDIF